MHNSDIRLLGVETTFDDISLETDFNIAGGRIGGFTVARVAATVADRSGRRATGSGATVLSVPWSWPDASVSLEARDGRVRQLVDEFASLAIEIEAADPFEIWRQLDESSVGDETKPGDPGPVPDLARHLALGAVDNAIHDGWASAAEMPVYEMYTAEFLNRDLASYLSSEFSGRWPGEFLATPRHRLPIQHVVGVGDPIAGASSGQRSLEDWAREDKFRHVKIKLSGSSVTEDVARVQEVFEVMETVVGDVRLALDPNEGYPDIASVSEMLVSLQCVAPRAAASIEYVEQPIPRGVTPRFEDIAPTVAEIPIIVDEGFGRFNQIEELTNDGWDGFVVKAAKGQSLAILCQAFARFHAAFLAVQDLTAVDLALEHSARLASNLAVSVEGFECNSRQYAPSANARLARARPGLVNVVEGFVSIEKQTQPGLY